MLALNLLLALIWMLLRGRFQPGSFLVGFALGYVGLALARGPAGETAYFGKARQLAGFGWFFLCELFRANLRVALEVVTPRLHVEPGIVAVPLDLRSDEAITLLANLITLTPGALTLDVSEDRTTLFVHTLYVRDPDVFRRQIKEGFERRVRELFE
ncbi:MAG: Na+/H+ antiporter subunit E [Polyangiaceae bacterium]